MRHVLVVIIGILMLTSMAVAQPPEESIGVECNWGWLTMKQVLEGFDQGGHASDPSGDGHGSGDADAPRAGLANVVEQGNLEASCELIEELLYGSAQGPVAQLLAVKALVRCNWGLFTMEAVLEGFDQGGHASDPSGDGHGSEDVDAPRAGLANVVEQGNLQALCEILASP